MELSEYIESIGARKAHDSIIKSWVRSERRSDDTFMTLNRRLTGKTSGLVLTGRLTLIIKSVMY